MRCITLIIIAALTLFSCGGGGDDGAGPAPTLPQLGAFNLTFPNNNEICTEGTDISETMVSIPFRWTTSTNATSYKLEVTSATDGQKYESTSNTNSDDIVLPKGTQFTWKVIAVLNNDTKEGNETRNFYSEGIAVSNHIPFPAKITLADNKDSTINISWEGTDLDNDIEKYEVYLSDLTGSLNLIADTQETNLNKVSIAYDIDHILEIITKDKNGNSSSSKKTFRFKI